MKSMCIAGNIGKDATTRTTQSGTVTSWSVAVEERNGQDKRTLWFDCTLWGARGEKLAQYLTKGAKCAASGEFSTREHEGRTYLTLRVNEVTLLGGGQQRDEGQRREDRGQQQRSRSDMDDEIPF